MKFYRITDDCGWQHTCYTVHDDMTPDLLVLLTPHARRAEEITKEQYDAERSETVAKIH